MGDSKQQIALEQVTDFLKQNPRFFIDQPDVLDCLDLNESPQGTISLAQKQVQRLQAKNEQLHEQLHSLIENARQNTQLQQRVHQLCLRLMDTDSLAKLLPILLVELKEEFNADEVALRLFYGDHQLDLPELDENIDQLHINDASLKPFDKVLDKHNPTCGRLSKAQKQVLFSEHHAEVASVACIPIGHDPCAGLLAIASYNQDRFHSNMATDYLAFLGDVLMRLLRGFGHVHHG